MEMTMSNRYWRRIVALSLVAGILGLVSACSMDVTNPNSADEQQVITNADGIQALAVGMQRYYSASVLGTWIINTGVTSRELTINTTFIGQVLIENGGEALDGSVGTIATIFGNLLNVMRMSEQLMEHTPTLPLEPGTRSGILALAHFYKAVALGHLIQAFEQAPLSTDPTENATFHSRSEVLAAAIDHLNTAEKLLTDTPVSATFQTKIKSSRLDLPNTIAAYRARFLLLAGNYQAAIDASRLVNPSVASYFAYDDLGRNPLFTSLVQSRTYAPRDGMGTPVTETGDARLNFFLIPDNLLSNPRLYPIERLAGFFTTGTSPIPAYIPGEMALIRAEAHLRLGELGAAVQEINSIRTKTAASDPVGLGAALAQYAGPITEVALTEEIYRQRAAELYLQGLRWEDSRRLGRPGPPATLDERNRNFWPYPDQERRNNPNTPPNPAI
jgi:starch-binding outer membrane protein, SusD/RagB family